MVGCLLVEQFFYRGRLERPALSDALSAFEVLSLVWVLSGEWAI
jgi:hypothetical protein